MPVEARLGLNRKTVLAANLARIGLVAWAFYYFLPQLATNMMLDIHGWSPFYLSFYWLVDCFLLGIIFLAAWKFFHPLAEIALFLAIAPCGYGTTRYFLEGMLALNMPGTIATASFTGIATFALFFNLFLLVRNIGHQRFAPVMKGLRRNKLFKIALIYTIGWTGITAWSYIGFNQVYVVRDFHQPSFSVSFWDLPSMGFNVSAYKDQNGIDEMNRYKALNASFYCGIDDHAFAGDMTSWEGMLNEWAKYNVTMIFCPVPRSNPAEVSTGDFTTYYHVQQMNDSIHWMMEWMSKLNSTVRSAIRGLSFDVEGPNYLPLAEYPISRAQYELAVRSYQGILDEFQQNTSCTTHLISMAGIIFDAMDGENDHDIDIAQRTVSSELNWTQYGFMTYMASEYPASSPYEYVFHCQAGVEQWGTDFVPWVGWWDNVNLSAGEIPMIDRPGMYDQAIGHVKIAKSSGVAEVVIAPSRGFLYDDRNVTKILQRLDDLIAIKAGFETFTVPITNNMRMFTNWRLYWQKIVPYYIWSSENVTLDLVMGTPGNWLALLQACFVMIVVAAGIYRMRKQVLSYFKN